MPSLRQLRCGAALSQADLAARLQMSQHTISMLERGRQRPSFRTIRKLAAALGVEPAQVDEFRAALGLPGHDERGA